MVGTHLLLLSTGLLYPEGCALFHHDDGQAYRPASVVPAVAFREALLHGGGAATTRASDIDH